MASVHEICIFNEPDSVSFLYSKFLYYAINKFRDKLVNFC